MKGLRATESHSADRAAKAKQKVNQTAELEQYSKTRFLSFHRELVKNHSSFSFMNVLYLRCEAWSAEWLSVTRSIFMVLDGRLLNKSKRDEDLKFINDQRQNRVVKFLTQDRTSNKKICAM